jgi:thiol-disulfide isomerase/thioredoxin
MATVVLGLRALLAVVFLTAGVGKLLDLEGSRRAMRDFGAPERLAARAGPALPVAELAIGLALVLAPTARWAALAALLLLTAFIAGIGRALARGEQPDCHCFGQIHSAPAGRVTLARNVVLATCAAVIVAYGSGPAFDTWISARSAWQLVAIAAVLCAVAAVAYAWSVRRDVRRLRRDLETAGKVEALGRSGLPVGYDAPVFALPDLRGRRIVLTDLLERGKPVLLMFMSPGCTPCVALMPRVRDWQQTLSERLTIAVLTAGTAAQNAVFEEHGLDYVLLQEQKEVADLFGVIATPSALFVSRDGKIASQRAESEFGIEPLVRLALRDGVAASLAGTAS